MDYATRRAAAENAAYIMDPRNTGPLAGFDEATMTITMEMGLYLTREEAAARGLPSPEDLLGEPWNHDPYQHSRVLVEDYGYHLPGMSAGPWSVWTQLDWEAREDGSTAWYYEEVEVTVPARYEVCDTCGGRGRHVNPAIDCGGLTSEDFDEDPDFRRDYFRGRYDQTCNACRGARVYPEVDRKSADPATLAALDERARDDAAYRRECAAEARMGA